MAAPAYSLLSTQEALDALKADNVGNVTARLEGVGSDSGILQMVTELCEEIADTQLVERNTSDIEEVHDLQTRQGFLQLRRRPVRVLTSVLIGDSTSALDASNYHIDMDAGRILMKGSDNTGRAQRPPSAQDVPGFVDFPEDYYVRLGGGSFPSIVQAATVNYRGGYETTAKVPGQLKRAATDILTRWWREEERKSQGKVSEVAQGFTFVTKFENTIIPPEALRILKAVGNISRTARNVVQVP